MKQQNIWNIKLLFIIVLIPVLAACGDDNENNSTNNGGITPIDNNSFYLDGIRYNIISDGLTVSGWDRNNFKGNAKIPSTIRYNNNSYEEITINTAAFLDCLTLTSIEIPSSVKIIEMDAFGRCKNLKSVVFSEGVMVIRFAAFAECTSLTSIVLPNSVIRLEESVFESCRALESITLGKSLTTIQRFVFQNCYALKYVHCLSEKPFYIDSSDIIPKGITLYVPKGCLEAYTNSLWVLYFEKILEE